MLFIVLALLLTIFLLVVVVLRLMGKIDTLKRQEQLDAYRKQKKARVKQPKSSRRNGSSHWLSYPSPLNRWGLWN